MDVLLGRKKSSSRIKALAILAISRVTVLKNQRRVRCSLAQSDVIQLLNLGHQERALLRTEFVIKEQNMFDVLSMIEGYCQILAQSVGLLDKNKELPDELREAIACLTFAAPRCGEFPELREICRVISKSYWEGYTITASAAELNDNCGVNPKIVEKLNLARQPSIESRLMALKVIASDSGITLRSPNADDEGNCQEIDHEDDQTEPQRDNRTRFEHESCDSSAPGEANEDEKHINELQDSRNSTRDCNDTAVAANEAFKLDTGATAARAIVPLSRSDTSNPIFDDDGNSIPGEVTDTLLELLSQGGPSDKNRIHYPARNGRVLDRRHNIMREASNRKPYTEVAAYPSILNGKGDTFYQQIEA